MDKYFTRGLVDSEKLNTTSFKPLGLLYKSVLMGLLLAHIPLPSFSVRAAEPESASEPDNNAELTDITTLLPVTQRSAVAIPQPEAASSEVYVSDMAASDSADSLLGSGDEAISMNPPSIIDTVHDGESDIALSHQELGIRPVGVPSLSFGFSASPLVASTDLQLSPEAFQPRFQYGYSPLDFDANTDDLIETAQLISQAAEEEGGEAEEELSARLARQSSNPLGGNFIILLNQIDRYWVNGNIVEGKINLTSWAIQPVISVPLKEQLGENWIWVTRPTFPIILNKDIPDTGAIRDAIGETVSGSQLPGGASSIPGAPPYQFDYQKRVWLRRYSIIFAARSIYSHGRLGWRRYCRGAWTDVLLPHSYQ